MTIEVRLEKLGEGIEEAEVSFWHHKEGEVVEKGEDLVELTTEKASFNLPAPEKGNLSKIFFQVGEKIKVGEVIATIETE